MDWATSIPRSLVDIAAQRSRVHDFDISTCRGNLDDQGRWDRWDRSQLIPVICIYIPDLHIGRLLFLMHIRSKEWVHICPHEPSGTISTDPVCKNLTMYRSLLVFSCVCSLGNTCDPHLGTAEHRTWGISLKWSATHSQAGCHMLAFFFSNRNSGGRCHSWIFVLHPHQDTEIILDTLWVTKL